jgi:hypothetical protein
MADLINIVDRLSRRLGAARGEPVPRDGGITNRNYRVRFGERDCVLRLPGRDTELLGIDRAAERVGIERAAALGIAPRSSPPTTPARVLWEAGRPHELMAGGYRAIDALRLEKGYRVWAADITPDETPLEAGLDFCVREDRSFVGADALGEPRRRLRCLLLEDPRSVALGNEPVRVGEEICGRVTTGGYGYTVGRSIAYAYLPTEHGVGTEVHVDIFGRWVAGEVAAEPLLDPEGARLRVVT